jgi:hypothetical protein
MTLSFAQSKKHIVVYASYYESKDLFGDVGLECGASRLVGWRYRPGKDGRVSGLVGLKEKVNRWDETVGMGEGTEGWVCWLRLSLIRLSAVMPTA